MGTASKTYHLTPVGVISICAGLVCFLTALIFGCITTVEHSPNNSSPNIGFAVASGLCLIAAAVTEAGSTKREPAAGEPKSATPTTGGLT
jgi:hypothetical protein